MDYQTVQNLLTIGFDASCVAFSMWSLIQFIAHVLDRKETEMVECVGDVCPINPELLTQLEVEDETKEELDLEQLVLIIENDWSVVEPSGLEGQCSPLACGCVIAINGRLRASNDAKIMGCFQPKANDEPVIDQYSMWLDHHLSLTIRELKALAKKDKIKGYGKMTKRQLAEALAEDCVMLCPQHTRISKFNCTTT